jgi:hypothetical protein
VSQDAWGKRLAREKQSGWGSGRARARQVWGSRGAWTTGDLRGGSRLGVESIGAAGSTPTAPMIQGFRRSWSAAPANDGFLDLDIRLHVAKELLPSALHIVPLGIAPRSLEQAL